MIRYFSLKQLAQLILHIPGLPSRKLNSKSFLVGSKSQSSIFAFPSLSETAHRKERSRRDVPNTSYCDGESETNQTAVPGHAEPVHFSSFYLELGQDLQSVVQLIPVLSGQGFLISFLETLVFRFQSHRDYFHL